MWGKAGHQYTMEAAGLPLDIARALGKAAWAPDTSFIRSLNPFGDSTLDSRTIHLLTGENAAEVPCGPTLHRFSVGRLDAVRGAAAGQASFPG
jgi:hypothetical protein